jgi:hypothetical protein
MCSAIASHCRQQGITSCQRGELARKSWANDKPPANTATNRDEIRLVSRDFQNRCRRFQECHMVKVTSAENRILRDGTGLDDNEIVVPRDNKVFLCNVKSIYSFLITLYVRKAYHSLGIKDELHLLNISIFNIMGNEKAICHMFVRCSPLRQAQELRCQEKTPQHRP